MFAIQKSRGPRPKCIANILPCRIGHNGAVNASKRYWSPTKSKEGEMVSYFRGRKLHGRRVKVPGRFTGVILSSTDQKLAREVQASEDDDTEVDQFEETGILAEQAQFSELMVWGHEALPDESADPFVRGIEEWISFAEEIHSYFLLVQEDLKNDKSS